MTESMGPITDHSLETWARRPDGGAHAPSPASRGAQVSRDRHRTAVRGGAGVLPRCARRPLRGIGQRRWLAAYRDRSARPTDRRRAGGHGEKRPFGATGLQVPEIGFGCGPTAALMINASAEERRAAVAEALSLGINYFDTALSTATSVPKRIWVKRSPSCTPSPSWPPRCIAVRGLRRHRGRGGAIGRGQRGTVAPPRDADPAPQSGRLSARGQGRVRLRCIADGGRRARTGRRAGGFRVATRPRLVRFFGCSAYAANRIASGRLLDSRRLHTLTLSYSALNPRHGRRRCRPCVIINAIGERAGRDRLAIVALRVLEADYSRAKTGLYQTPSPNRAAWRPWRLMCGTR